MMNGLVSVMGAIDLQLERLESNVRRHDRLLGELLENISVLNRKVEMIHDEQKASSFHSEEDPAERARSAHQAV